MKKIAICLIAGLICILTLTFMGCMKNTDQEAEQEEYNYMEVETRVESFTETKLKWEKHDVSAYHIYEINDAHEQIEILSLPGNATSCTINTEKNKEYDLRLEAEVEKGTEKIIKYYGEISFFSGLSYTVFTEYQLCDDYTSPTSIELNFYQGEGIEPDGFKLRRTECGKEDCKEIIIHKSSKGRNNGGQYIDRDVESCKKYSYTVSNFKEIDGKIVEGKSDTVTLEACWSKGRYKVTGEAEGSAPELTITSDKGNSQLSIDGEILLKCGYSSQKDSNTYYVISSFRKASGPWCTSGSLNVGHGETFYLKMKSISKDDPIYEDISDSDYNCGGEGELCIYGVVEYRGLCSDFEMNPYEGTASAYSNGEFYH